ncbi:hypothetical protein TPENAI_60923 [Tenacibaculum litopenaei]
MGNDNLKALYVPMKIFELTIDSNIHWEWKVVLSKKTDHLFKVIESIENDEEILFNNDTKIQMLLVNIQKDIKKRKEAPFQSDILYWTDDLVLDTYSPYKGIIISKKLKNILLSYVLPPYNLYPIDIINSENLEINTDYFLFHTKDRIIDITLFNESEYTYYKKRKEIKRSIGDFNSYEEFNLHYHKSFDDENIKIKMTKRVVSTKNDIIPNSLNHLYVKDTFYKESKNLMGVIFKEASNIVIK